MNLEEIRNNPAIMMHLRFDLTPGDVLEPKGHKTKDELKELAGFFFGIHIYKGRPRLVLVHMRPEGWGSPDFVSDFPEDMLIEAVKEHKGSSYGCFFPINKPIEDMIRAGLMVAGKKEGLK